MSGAEASGWRTEHSELLCDAKYLRVYREKIHTPTRPDKPVEWIAVRRPTAAVVAPRTPEGKYLLIRQERVVVQRTIWEFPAGQVDDKNATEEAIRATALRELGEEMGMDCRGGLEPLGFFFTSPGFTDECCHLFLARDVVPRAEGSRHDEHEAILEVRAFSGEELERMVAEGEIIDSNTLTTYARLRARRLL